MAEISPETVAEIGRLHRRLTESREVLYRIADENLPHTCKRLDAVSATTEAAATHLLDGLETAIATVDTLSDAGDDPVRLTQQTDELRNQLFDLIGHLQFQDIISQQLAYASSVLAEAENRLGALARNFGAGDPAEGDEKDPGEPRAFDPGATMRGQDARQALADELFTAGRAG